MKTWIYTITEPRNDWKTGDEAEFWTEARYDDAGDIIIRKDSAPAGEPSWQAGDRALAFDAASQRFFATLTVLVGATWQDGEDGGDGAYWTGMRLDKVNYYGPFVADTAATITQGSRKKIDPGTFSSVAKQLDTDWPGPPAGMDPAG